MQKKDNDLKITKSQIKDIYINAVKKVKEIESARSLQEITINDTEIGFKNLIIKDFDSYTAAFEDVLCNDKDFITFANSDLISFIIDFDKKGNMVKATYNYYPGKDCRNYIRIDYDPDSYVEKTHPICHMHNSVFENQIRFPVLHKIYPLDFLEFVLYHIYNIDVFSLSIMKNRKDQRHEQLGYRGNEAFFFTSRLGIH